MQDCHIGPAAGSQELVTLTLLQACVLLLGTQDLEKKKKVNFPSHIKKTEEIQYSKTFANSFH